MTLTSVVIERPPNFDRILTRFPKAAEPGVIFAYGGKIYNPGGGSIPLALLAHEEVHLNNQDTFGSDEWWERYLTEDQFRYYEELLAHAQEYRVQLAYIDGDRNKKAKLLTSTARRLVAELYGYAPPRSLQQAMKDLREEVE